MYLINVVSIAKPPKKSSSIVYRKYIQFLYIFLSGFAFLFIPPIIHIFRQKSSVLCDNCVTICYSCVTGAGDVNENHSHLAG